MIITNFLPFFEASIIRSGNRFQSLLDLLPSSLNVALYDVESLPTQSNRVETIDFNNHHDAAGDRCSILFIEIPSES